MGCPGHLFPSGGKCVLGTPECGGGSSPPASCVTTAVPDAAKVASMPKLDLGESLALWGVIALPANCVAVCAGTQFVYVIPFENWLEL